MLANFHARGFRTFEDLEIGRLGRVNLIVGRNNVGKTMLLQALRVFQSQGSSAVIYDLLRDRDEVPRTLDEEEPLDISGRSRSKVLYDEPLDIAALFHGRSAWLSSNDSRISLSSSGAGAAQLEISLREHNDLDASPPAKRDMIAKQAGGSNMYLGIVLDGELQEGIGVGDGFVVHPLRRAGWRSRRMSRSGDESVAPLLSTGSVDIDQLGAWWDRLSLTDAEQRVIACLRLVSPIERIAFVDHPFGRSRITLVKVEGWPDPMPLKALGDGVNRMFAMALALEIARSSKMLLIDEVENGIHYSVLPELWRFLFKAAAQSDVQIFATSHSWDCIEAFQQAASEHPEDGVLVKLSRSDDKVVSTVFEEDELQIATRDGIELR